MSIRRLLAVARKEFRHITRDVRTFFLVTVAPAFLLVTFSYVFAMDVDRMDIAIRDLDRTPLSRAFLASLTADGDFVIVAYVEREEEIEPLFARDIADLVLVIPHGFANAALRQAQDIVLGGALSLPFQRQPSYNHCARQQAGVGRPALSGDSGGHSPAPRPGGSHTRRHHPRRLRCRPFG